MNNKQNYINLLFVFFIIISFALHYHWYNKQTEYSSSLNEDKLRYMLKNIAKQEPNFFRLISQKTNQESKKTDEIAELIKTLFHSPYATTLGDKNAKYIIVEFIDYNCGYCRRAHSAIDKILKKHTDVKIVVWELPLLGEGSKIAAQAILASKKQGKYSAFHKALLQSSQRINEHNVFEIALQQNLNIEQLKRDMKHEDVKKSLNTAYEIAMKMGIQGTPYFFIDDTIVGGYVSDERMLDYVVEMKKKRCVYC